MKTIEQRKLMYRILAVAVPYIFLVPPFFVVPVVVCSHGGCSQLLNLDRLFSSRGVWGGVKFPLAERWARASKVAW